MAIATKPKKTLEKITTLKGPSAAGHEATKAAVMLADVANDPDTTGAFRSRAVVLAEELAAPATQTDSARRELVMQRVQAFANESV